MVRAKPLRLRRLLLPVVILGTVAIQPASAQAAGDREQDLQLALQQYIAAKNPAQRATVIDYLRPLDRKLVVAAVVDHIIASRDGMEATAYNELAAALNPDGCTALLDRIAASGEPTAKGKLIVALRHCHDEKTTAALAACLADTRPVTFEAHGPHPRRVCDLAYDELYLKLRSDPQYHLDSTPHLRGMIGEKTPLKTRAELIAKLKAKLSPAPTPTPSPQG